MAYTANSTKLYYKVGAATPVEVALLMEVPELGGAPEKIDVTTLSSKSKAYIPGMKDFGDLVFKFLYETGADGNYMQMQELETGCDVNDDATIPTFQIIYPDNTAHEFKAVPALKMDAGAINGALTFSATMTLLGDTGIQMTTPFANLPQA